jgi:hypothetical protein
VVTSWWTWPDRVAGESPNPATKRWGSPPRRRLGLARRRAVSLSLGRSESGIGSSLKTGGMRNGGATPDTEGRGRNRAGAWASFGRPRPETAHRCSPRTHAGSVGPSDMAHLFSAHKPYHAFNKDASFFLSKKNKDASLEQLQPSPPQNEK